MDIQQVKQALIAKKNELAQRGGSREAIAVETPAELIEGLQQLSDREIAAATLSRNWRLGIEVKEALERLERGELGRCLHCEEEISDARLKAVPWAKYCIHCQEAMERQESAVFAEAA